jgi:hypothetical protein
MSLSAEQIKLASVFPEIRWSPENLICIFRPEGTLTPALAGRMVAWLNEIEMDSEQPFHRFSDLTKLRTIEVSLSDIKEAAYWRRANYHGRSVKSAFLAHSDETLIIAHAYQSFMAGSKIWVKVFQSAKEAATWLGVPEEALGC